MELIDMSQSPLISVIITTFNRGEILRKVFRGWMNQSLENFEIVNVDDGSTDNTLEILESCKETFKRERPDIAFEIYQQKNKGPAGGRNLAISMAKGEILVFVDDDAYPVKRFLEYHLKWHLKYENTVVRGPIINVETWEEVSDYPPTGFFSRLRHYSKNYFCTANASIRRKFMVELGGFDESFKRWSDTEFAYRLRERYRMKWIFDFDAVVYHYKPPALLKDERNHFYREGIYAAKLYLKYPGNFRVKLRTGYFFPNTLIWKAVKEGRKPPFINDKRFKKLKYFVQGFMDTLKEGEKND